MELNKLDMTLEDLAKDRKSERGGQRRRRGGGSDRKSVGSGGAGRGRQQKQQSATAAPVLPIGKLLISNLHFKVTENDLKELFQTVGPLRKVSLAYDVSGRSKGTAEVEFVRANDATAAAKRYNGVELDNRPLRIELVARANILDRISGGNQAASGGSGNRLARGPRDGGSSGSRGNGRRRGGSGAPRREPKKPKTAEELDAEMDSYMTPGAAASTEAAAPVADGDVAME